MAFTKKGFWSGPVQDDFGNAYKNAAVTVLVAGTSSPAVLYPSEDGGTPVANPVTSDNHGSMLFYADPGYYDLTGDGVYKVRVVVAPSPNEPNVSTVSSVNGQIGDVVIPSDPAQNVAGLRTIGTAANQAAAGNDARWATETSARTAADVVLQSNIDAADTARALTDAAVADETTARQNGDSNRYTKSEADGLFDPLGAAAQAKSDLLGGAPSAALDTLLELGNQLTSDESAVAALTTTVAGKAADNAVVHLAGTETVIGAKDFTGGLKVNGNNAVDVTNAALSDTRVPTDGSVTNAKVSASAAIAYSKLALGTSIVNADIATAAAIAYSKLNLGTSIVNADISGSAAIAYSKLNLAASIVDGDVSALSESKITNLVSDLAAKIPLTQKGAASGVMPLGSDTRGAFTYTFEWRRPTGMVIVGHSWASSEMFPFSTSSWSRQRYWTQLLRTRYGINDNLYQQPAAVLAVGADANNPFFTADLPGSIMSVWYTTMSAITGANTNSRTFNFQKPAALITTHSLAMTSGVNTSLGVAKQIPAVSNAGTARALAAGDFLRFVSTHVGTGIADPGGIISATINGSYTNLAISGSKLMVSGHDHGGWSTLDVLMDKSSASYGIAHATFNSTQVTPTNGPGFILIGQNDWGIINDLPSFKEALRFAISKIKLWINYKDNDASVTTSNGSGGTATWSAVTSQDPTWTQGGRYTRLSGGTIGSTKQTLTVAVPSDFNAGEVVSLCFVAPPNAAGGTATITIDGSAPTGGVLINGGSSGAVSTTGVSTYTGDSTLGVPIVKRITGLAAGAHTILVTVNTLDGSGNFIFNWWGREAAGPATPVLVANQPVLLANGGIYTGTTVFGATGRTNAAAWNVGISAVAAEFGSEVAVVDLLTAMNETPSYFRSDGVHPSDLGHQVIAKAFDDALQTNAGVTAVAAMAR